VVLLPSDLVTILLGLLEGVACRTTMLLAGVPALLRLLSTLLLLLLEVPGRTALPAVLPGKWAYPSHFQPPSLHRRQVGFSSSHFLRRALVFHLSEYCRNYRQTNLAGPGAEGMS
jgi:Na+/H+ antiporter NhaD/arsenite permease-like protein